MSEDREEFGYLLAHFREEPDGYAERVFFSLSAGDSPLRWIPLWEGLPVLTSDIGTTGVRDPALVRGDDGRFHVLATDLRIYGGDGRGWDEWRRHGSRSLIVWASDDLISWSGPRAVTVAPEAAGMAWAPEVTRDAETGEHIVFWSSTLFGAEDAGHRGESYSRILFSRTRDFESFSPAETLIDAGRDIIDTAIVQHEGRVYRFSKHEERGAESWGIYQEVGDGLFATDFRLLARRIGEEVHPDVEAPIVVEAPDGSGWYLFLDRYGSAQGYMVLRTASLESGRWEPVPESEVDIRPATKHGTVLRLHRDEWERLSRFGPSGLGEPEHR
ncbi:glycoside hydrolase family 43 protein [Naasia aerilata]|uniref:Glycosyl hydrolase family 43 n=1 Tax=Naasia aerilata TaxID=1162966 RepID=A0ABN6XIM6_9MICO|nr:glycoside hydrolase family 43 protein [Naasia aerilata]BDZ44714.1 hypothetical protein GCM10025866_06230 [Naasia aerilata]